MTGPPNGPLNSTLRVLGITGTDATCLAACVTFFTAWEVIATRTISWQVPAFFAVFSYSCVLAGRPGVRLLRLGPDGTPDFATSFLIGFSLLSCGLYLLAAGIALRPAHQFRHAGCRHPYLGTMVVAGYFPKESGRVAIAR